MPAYRRGVRYDAIVVGLGVMGAAVLSELAGRGRRVLGLDRFPLPHALGSSQGDTRIIREAYFEDPRYVPLVQDAYRRWLALEGETGTTLLVPTGGLTIGPPDGRLVTGALESARMHGLAHEVWDARTLQLGCSTVRVPAGHVAVREPRAGVLLAARCVAALLAQARRDGAEVRDGVVVEAWDPVADGVRVRAGGETLDAGRLVLAAGAWMPGLAPSLAPHLTVERNVVHWFAPRDTGAWPPPPAGVRTLTYTPADLPVLVIEDAPDNLLYAIPVMRALGEDLEAGVKFARHHSGDVAVAETVRRQVTSRDVGAIVDDVARYMPGLEPTPRRSAVCCYTNTPDGHFIVDRDPAHPAVILVSPCSGHGFKFAPVIGAMAAELACDAASPSDRAPFAVARLTADR
jgi:sarcosine oxidase